MMTPTTPFLLGFIFAFVLLTLVLKSPRQLRRGARVFLAIADALEGKKSGKLLSTPETACADPIQAEVTAALEQLEGKASKARRAELAAIAAGAAAANPGTSFDVVFRAAVKIAAARPLAALTLERNLSHA